MQFTIQFNGLMNCLLVFLWFYPQAVSALEGRTPYKQPLCCTSGSGPKNPPVQEISKKRALNALFDVGALASDMRV
jgi:hypothetical protein